MPAAHDRPTIPVDAHLYRRLQRMSKKTDRDLADLVEEAVRLLIQEEAEDLADLEAREGEERVDFGEAVKDLKSRGRL